MYLSLCSQAPSYPPSPVVDGCYATFDNGSMKQCFAAMAGKNYTAGSVCVELVNRGIGDTVKITYDTSGSDYCLTEVQAYFGDLIPVNTAGNPQIGTFPAKATMKAGTCIKTYSLETPLSPDCVAGAEYMKKIYKLAAHSHVQFADGSGGQTAWTTGTETVSGGSWAMYSEASLACQCPRTFPPIAGCPAEPKDKIIPFIADEL